MEESTDGLPKNTAFLKKHINVVYWKNNTFNQCISSCCCVEHNTNSWLLTTRLSCWCVLNCHRCLMPHILSYDLDQDVCMEFSIYRERHTSHLLYESCKHKQVTLDNVFFMTWNEVQENKESHFVIGIIDWSTGYFKHAWRRGKQNYIFLLCPSSDRRLFWDIFKRVARCSSSCSVVQDWRSFVLWMHSNLLQFHKKLF